MSQEIQNDEWEYLEGVLDQELLFGIWPDNRFPHTFAHRIDFYNTSLSLVSLLREHFQYGKVAGRDHVNKYPFSKKTEFLWSIPNAEEGLRFLDIVQDHLHFKRPLAEKYAAFLDGLIYDSGNTDDLLGDFQRLRSSPPSEGIYLPTPRNLAGRLDTNGFIGIQIRPNAPLSRAYPVVNLGTKYPEIPPALKKEYGGTIIHRKTHDIWAVSENQAQSVLEAVLPYLRNMRDRTILVLEFEEVNRILKTREVGSKLRDLIIDGLGDQPLAYDPTDLLRLGYIQQARILNANPV